MLKEKHSPAKLMTLGAMVTALSVLSIFAAASLPVGKLPFLFFASACVCVLTCERAYATAVISYIASVLISFWLVADKLVVILFALLPGHYGIIRAALQARVNSRALRGLFLLLYCDICAGLGIYLAMAVFFVPIDIPYALPVWAAALLLQLAFIVYDLLYGAVAAIYAYRLRRIIVPRR